MKTPTRFIAPLTDEEREKLATIFKTHASHSARIRAHAILLSERQFPPGEIAEIFNVHRNTVVEWFKRWQEERSVEDLSGRGSKPKLADVVACIDNYSLGLVKPTLLVIDGASIQVSQECQARLEIWEERDLFIYLLPGYSPELNLIEILWRMSQYHWLSRAAYQSFKLLSKYLLETLSQVGSKYQINFAH